MVPASANHIVLARRSVYSIEIGNKANTTATLYHITKGTWYSAARSSEGVAYILELVTHGNHLEPQSNSASF